MITVEPGRMVGLWSRGKGSRAKDAGSAQRRHGGEAKWNGTQHNQVSGMLDGPVYRAPAHLPTTVPEMGAPRTSRRCGLGGGGSRSEGHLMVAGRRYRT